MSGRFTSGSGGGRFGHVLLVIFVALVCWSAVMTNRSAGATGAQRGYPVAASSGLGLPGGVLLLGPVTSTLLQLE